MASQVDCSICYQAVDHKTAFVCGVGDCITVNCIECTVAYYGYTLEQRSIPFCPGCRRDILLKDVKDKEYLDSYLKCVEAYLRSIYSGKDEFKEKIEMSALYAKIRKDRTLFMDAKFPVAVQLVAKLCMQNKTAKINKETLQMHTVDRKGSRIPCMKMACQGTLDDKHVCRLCDTPFCKECERIKKNDHICNPDDLASVREVRKIVQCPKCSIPIFRSAGCDHMTCASCKTTFNYVSGEASDYGSHNPGVNLKKRYSLVEEFTDLFRDLQVLDLVKKMEDITEPTISPSYGRDIVTLLESQNTPKDLLVKLVKEQEKLTKSETRFKNSKKGLVEIEDAIREKKITTEMVKEIYKKI